MSRNPNQPSLLEEVILFQAIQGILNFSFVADHQNRLIALVISCIRFLGKRKHDIVYAGSAVITAFNKTSFPAGGRNLVYQPSLF